GPGCDGGCCCETAPGTDDGAGGFAGLRADGPCNGDWCGGAEAVGHRGHWRHFVFNSVDLIGPPGAVSYGTSQRRIEIAVRHALRGGLSLSARMASIRGSAM